MVNFTVSDVTFTHVLTYSITVID